jgi:hypothetical protein
MLRGAHAAAVPRGGPLEGPDQPVDMDASDGKLLDANDLFLRLTLDTITEFLLGKSVNSLRFAAPPQLSC